MTKNLKYSLLILLLANFLLVISCSKEKEKSPLLEEMSTEIILNSTSNRAMTEGTKEKEGIIAFSVLYEGDLDEMIMSQSSDLNKMIELYEFNLEEPFVVDEIIKGIVLRTIQPLADPIAIAKDLSNIDGVMMVEVKNLPLNDV
ncbi:hypothetical protein [Aureispira anguillae]|uniref:Uncharacterized protein n=1 Tax=Aureispira anguillae TaxID=2864201 RepID=A0A916DWV2_9BACT|nr:hypothetical protein [Aureispira anguillae]BDS15100.1 hypothetical protein AsAng_0058840 [Aureispira anguillae]